MELLNLPKGWRREDVLGKDYQQLLPKGWRREELLVRGGKCGGGRYEISYTAPTGERFTGKTEMQKFFGPGIDLTFFNYRTGRLNLQALKKVDRSARTRALHGPARQTQPPAAGAIGARVVKTQPDSRVNDALKAVAGQERPRQIFWEKRLERLDADQPVRAIDLPRRIRAVGPNVNQATAVRSISARLHRDREKVLGQSDARMLDKNPSVFVNPDQPLVAAVVVTEEDVRRQEEKVKQARARLQASYKLHLPGPKSEAKPAV